jgi:hypothetical protein
MDVVVLGLRTRLEDGRASFENDRHTIMNFVVKEATTIGLDRVLALEKANTTLHSILARMVWPQAVKRGLAGDLDATNPGALSLPRILRNSEMTDLRLSLTMMDEVLDADLKTLGEGLPATLRQVHLNFYSCHKITNKGVKNLMQHLPNSTQVLQLDFLGCRQVSDIGLRIIAENLPASLETLRLDFAGCPRITKAGLRPLVDKVPEECEFSGTFLGTRVNHNFSTREEM